MIKGKPQPKVKVKSISFLKKKAWKLFSEYIRRRHADTGGTASCVTCSRAYHWKQLQAGHFIPGRHNSILFDPRGVHPQCYRCNVPMKGNPREYDAWMRRNYGPKIIKDLEKKDKEFKQWTRPELEEIIKHFKQKVEELTNK